MSGRLQPLNLSITRKDSSLGITEICESETSQDTFSKENMLAAKKGLAELRVRKTEFEEMHELCEQCYFHYIIKSKFDSCQICESNALRISLTEDMDDEYQDAFITLASLSVDLIDLEKRTTELELREVYSNISLYTMHQMKRTWGRNILSEFSKILGVRSDGMELHIDLKNKINEINRKIRNLELKIKGYIDIENGIVGI